MSIYYYISLLFVLGCVVTLAIMNYNLTSSITTHRDAIKSSKKIIGIQEESILRLENMLDDCLSYQIRMISYLDNFKSQIPAEKFKQFKDDGIKLAKIKECYVERWTEADQAKVSKHS